MNRNKIESQTPLKPSRATRHGHFSAFFERMSRRFAERMGRLTAGFTLVQWWICWVLFLTVGVTASMYVLFAQFLVTTEPDIGLMAVEGKDRPRSPPGSSDEGVMNDGGLSPLEEPKKGTTDPARDSLEKSQ